METVWRQIRPSRLTKEQFKVKLRKDSEYEITVQNLYASLPREQAIAEKKVLWEEYLTWAKANGLYEQVTPEQQLIEAESFLNEQLAHVNVIRTELGLKKVNIVAEMS